MKRMIILAAGLFLLPSAAPAATFQQMVAKGDLEAVKQYVKTSHPDLNSLNDQGMTALDWALYHKQEKVALALLSMGAGATVVDARNCTPLHYASQKGVLSVVKALLAKGVKVDAADKDGLTALHYASGSVGLSVRMKDGVMNVDMTLTPEESLGVARELISHHFNVMARSKDGSTPLHFACRTGYHQTAVLLLDHKADPNAQDEMGNAPLHVTGNILSQDFFKESDEKLVYLKNMLLGWSRKTIRIMLERGARADLKNKKAETALQSIPPLVINSDVRKWLEK